MRNNCLHQPLAQALPSIFLHNKHIPEIRKSCKVTDDSGKTNLLVVMIHPETKRILDRGQCLLKSAGFSPIRFLRKKTMNGGEVEPALREAFKRKDDLVFLDIVTDQTENVYPMIPGGKGLSEMILV